MSELKNKSEQNLISAQYLMSKACFASSVHCSYYSCVQLMLHILRSDLNKTEAEIDIEGQQEGSFHNWLQGQISFAFLGKNSFEDSRTVSSYFGQLKALRVKADYKNVEIKPKQAANSIETAKNIIKLLENNFTI